MNVKPPQFNSTAEFFAQALAIETEASERYTLLADQMEVHHNLELTKIFRRMADIEAKHRKEISRRAGDALVEGEPASFSWLNPDGPETLDLQAVHYLMTPYRALKLARHNEERAATYFQTIAKNTTNPEIAVFAAEMAREEREHVVWVDKWLQHYPPGDRHSNDDPDPPVYSG